MVNIAPQYCDAVSYWKRYRQNQRVHISDPNMGATFVQVLEHFYRLSISLSNAVWRLRRYLKQYM